MGDTANLRVLERRELENYLLDSKALGEFIADKMRRAGNKEDPPSEVIFRRSVTNAIDGLQPEVVRLRAEKMLLAPVFLQTRTHVGTIAERLRVAAEHLAAKANDVERTTAQIQEQVARDWDTRSHFLVPGSQVLECLMKEFGVNFSKSKGDGEKLASFLSPSSIPNELSNLIREIAG